MSTSALRLSDRGVRQLEFLINHKKLKTIIENWADGTLKNTDGVLVDIKKETLIRAISKRYKTCYEITACAFEEMLRSFYDRIDFEWERELENSPTVITT